MKEKNAKKSRDTATLKKQLLDMYYPFFKYEISSSGGGGAFIRRLKYCPINLYKKLENTDPRSQASMFNTFKIKYKYIFSSLFSLIYYGFKTTKIASIWIEIGLWNVNVINEK